MHLVFLFVSVALLLVSPNLLILVLIIWMLYALLEGKLTRR